VENTGRVIQVGCPRHAALRAVKKNNFRVALVVCGKLVHRKEQLDYLVVFHTLPYFAHILALVGGYRLRTTCPMEEWVPAEQWLMLKQVSQHSGQDAAGVASGLVVHQTSIQVVLEVQEEQCEPIRLPATTHTALPVVPAVSGIQQHSTDWRNASDWRSDV